MKLKFGLFIILVGTLLIVFVTGNSRPKQQVVSPYLLRPITPSPTFFPYQAPVFSYQLPVFEESLFISRAATMTGQIVVLPEWYSIDERGNIVFTSSGQKQAVINEATAYKIRLLPIISSKQNGSGLHSFLLSTEKQQNLISVLATEAATYNFAGYSIDWEPQEAEQIVPFISFLNNISSVLRKDERMIEITVSQANQQYLNKAVKVVDQFRLSLGQQRVFQLLENITIPLDKIVVEVPNKEFDALSSLQNRGIYQFNFSSIYPVSESPQL